MLKKSLWQTVWTKIRLLLWEQPVLGPSCLASILNSSAMLGNYLQQTTSGDDIFRCVFFIPGALRVNISITDFIGCSTKILCKQMVFCAMTILQRTFLVCYIYIPFYHIHFILNTFYHGWASAELPRNRVNVNLFLRHIRNLRGRGIVTEKPKKGRYSHLF